MKDAGSTARDAAMKAEAAHRRQRRAGRRATDHRRALSEDPIDRSRQGVASKRKE